MASEAQPRPTTDALLVERVPIDTVDLDPKNARSHEQASGQAAIRASLARFGQRKPIVVWRSGDGAKVTKAGNGTLLAARELGWTEIWVAWADGLTEQEANAYAVADNQTTLLSSWNFPNLAEVLRGMDEDLRGLTGFDESSISMLLKASFEPDRSGSLSGDDSPSGGREEDAARTVALTERQSGIFDAACRLVRERAGGASLSDGECVEVLCVAYAEPDEA